MEIVFVGFWLAVSILVAKTAGRRGRGELRWFAASLLVSPLVTGVLLFCCSNLTEQKRLESLKKCPRCAEMVQSEAVICKHCHTEFGTLAAL